LDFIPIFANLGALCYGWTKLSMIKYLTYLANNNDMRFIKELRPIFSSIVVNPNSGHLLIGKNHKK